MTDARLPGHFLNMPKFDELSDLAVRVLVSSLMWSAEQGTDGEIPHRYVKRLHPDGAQAAAYAELIAAGFWRATPTGIDMPGWSTWLGQSTDEQVQQYRAAARERQRKYRERQAAARRRDRSSESRVTRDVTGDVARDVGGGGGGGGGESDYTPGSVSWPVVAIPRPEYAENELI